LKLQKVRLPEKEETWLRGAVAVRRGETDVRFISKFRLGADRCCKTGFWGAVVAALCCLTPLLVFLLGAVGVAFLTPYLDYLLVPVFAIFLILAFYGWMQGGKIISRKRS
jgi:mercuric ion transport protein